jgi:light-regulated signal transduction histidine kinase (bacteriophytochrome)/CheY-like chemotaxis protein
MNPQDQVDLSNCDREPIHIPGTIQPFGALIAVNTDWLVAHRSANAQTYLSLPTLPRPGESLLQHFTQDACNALREALRTLTDRETVQRLFGIDLTGSGELFDVAIHFSKRLVLIEAERHDAELHATSLSALRPLMARLANCQDVEGLCQAAAEGLAQLLGLSRVMVYKFHADDSGEVIAEVIEPGQDSFLHLRYPASDIPRQARALYLRNLLRIIGDTHAASVPIEPAVGLGGEPVDLSLSTLRAVSPIHIEYLKNMGVDASLSVSIVIRGKLWGLFACHHLQPLVLPFSLRTSAELFAQLFALLLDQRLGDEERALSEHGRELHDRVMVQLAEQGDLTDNIEMVADAVSPLVAHDGITAYIDGDYRARGFAPTREEFLEIVPMLNSAAASSVMADNQLARAIPAAEAVADRAAGALVIPVSRRPRDYIVLWRRPLTQTVVWAGNPEKSVDYGPNGDRLTPRKSFAEWRQTVEGKSEPWSDAAVRLAEMLRVTLLEVLLRLSDDANRERERAQQKQELLIAELNHRVRNILTLIRGLVGQSRTEARTVAEFADVLGGRVRALALAHDAITRENWNPASLRRLIELEGEAYNSAGTNRVRISGEDALVQPEAYSVLALVIHEMMSNSVKYGGLCDSSGWLEITLAIVELGDLKLSWREVGGPPVKTPKRRGFGSTIIERSIPFDLKGAARIDYRIDGVEAEFIIPARFVERIERADRAPTRAPAGEPATDAPGSSGAVERVLLVEDNIIIAMDTEQSLLDLGVAHVDTVSSVSAARDRLAQGSYDLAVLDYNLGDETSLPLAQDLLALAVPVVFATGYGDATPAIESFPKVGVLKKPYTREDIEAILKGLGKN